MGTGKRVCPACGTVADGEASSCRQCGVDLDMLYLPYPLLASAVVVAIRMVEAAERSLVAANWSWRAALLGLTVALGATLYGLALRRPWGRWLALGAAVPAVVAGLVGLTAGQHDGQTWRLVVEGGLLAGYLSCSAGRRIFGGVSRRSS